MNTASALRALLRERQEARAADGTGAPDGASRAALADPPSAPLRVSLLTAPGVTYAGETLAGLPHGRGVQAFAAAPPAAGAAPSGPSASAPGGFARVYVGEFARGKRHGRGRMVTWEGEVHEGEWREDGPGGEGAFLFKWAERGKGRGEGRAGTGEGGRKGDRETADGAPAAAPCSREPTSPAAASSSAPLPPSAPRRRLRGFVGSFAGAPHGLGALTFADGGSAAGTFRGLRLEAPDEAAGRAAAEAARGAAEGARSVAAEVLAAVAASEPQLAADVERMPAWAEPAA